MLAEAMAPGNPLTGVCSSFRTCQDLWENGHAPLGPCQPSPHLETLLATRFGPGSCLGLGVFAGSPLQGSL